MSLFVCFSAESGKEGSNKGEEDQRQSQQLLSEYHQNTSQRSEEVIEAQSRCGRGCVCVWVGVGGWAGGCAHYFMCVCVCVCVHTWIRLGAEKGVSKVIGIWPPRHFFSFLIPIQPWNRDSTLMRKRVSCLVLLALPRPLSIRHTARSTRLVSA